jgi:hypothetical protein
VPGIATTALNRDGSVIYYKNSWDNAIINGPYSSTITSTTKIEIASMTKSIVSVAILQLVEQDEFGLDDLVEDYIPSYDGRTYRFWTDSLPRDNLSSVPPRSRPPSSTCSHIELGSRTGCSTTTLLSGTHEPPNSSEVSQLLLLPPLAPAGSMAAALTGLATWLRASGACAWMTISSTTSSSPSVSRTPAS